MNTTLTRLLVVVLSCPASAVVAEPILQPISVTSNMGTGYGSLDALRNQSGLSIAYTSLVTDFSSYIASNPIHNSSPDVNGWSSLLTTGNLDFNLGGSHTIDSMVLWGADGWAFSLRGFDILLDDNPSFDNPVNVGSFIASIGGPLISDSKAQVFTFLPTTASYVRLSITSNYGDNRTVIGEVAFGQASQPSLPPTATVPEPTTIVLWSGMAVALVLAQRRKSMSAPTR